jgi:kinetochore protein Mis12/MTW1
MLSLVNGVNVAENSNSKSATSRVIAFIPTTMSPHPPPTVPSTLLPELLGFSPQLLLDDVINVANNAVTETVDGMEIFLLRWAEERTQTTASKDWDSNQDIEQGLVAFQTLLESHIDIAFDFFELWSLRNIFAIPADLPIVAPHHRGLDLQSEPERELELMTEIEELRRKIDNVRLTHHTQRVSHHSFRSASNVV